MKVLVTGNRKLGKLHEVSAVTDELERVHDRSPISLVIHGGALGVDSIADRWAEHHGIHTAVIKAVWSAGKKAGPIRNQVMVDLYPDLCLAFPIGNSPGTRDCIMRAERAGIQVMVFEMRER